MKRNSKKTYCPWLWEAIYIYHNGNVFICCHQKPEILGNIYQEKLKDICNNVIVRNLRERSLNGQLKCFKKCTILNKEKIVESKTTLMINYSDLKVLKINFGEACNINCIMCRQNSKSRVLLDYDKLVENADISPFESIEIQGGEPLFIPSAKKFFDYSASQNKKSSFLTNGLLINEEWAKKIALYSSFVYFSLNAVTKETHELINRGSKWERVLKNIQMVHDFKEKLNTKFDICGHMTIVTENLEEIPLFIKKFKDFGFDTINFGFDREVPKYLRIHPWKKRHLKLQIKEALHQCEYRSMIDLLRLELLGLV